MSSILTGITTSGSPHLGNYVGAIKPSLRKIKESKKSFLFLADYHSLIKQQDPLLTHKSSLKIASAWLACGLNPKETCFYRQSKVPQIMELIGFYQMLLQKDCSIEHMPIKLHRI